MHTCHSIVFTHYRGNKLCKGFCFTDQYQMEVMLFFCRRSPFRFVKQGQWIQNRSWRHSVTTWFNYYALQTPHSSPRSINSNHSERGYNICHWVGTTGAIQVHCCVLIQDPVQDTPASWDAPNFPTIFEDSETRMKHASTISARLYSKNNSWIVKSLWILDWKAATEVVFWRRGWFMVPPDFDKPVRRRCSI